MLYIVFSLEPGQYVVSFFGQRLFLPDGVQVEWAHREVVRRVATTSGYAGGRAVPVSRITAVIRVSRATKLAFHTWDCQDVHVRARRGPQIEPLKRVESWPAYEEYRKVEVPLG